MCGISGFIDPSLGRDDAHSLMKKMLASIAHRGPDNSTIEQVDGITLGHNRLTIIDLSDEANQPMTRGDLVLIFNGEIYNYIEVRKELEMKGHRFTTSSDTEVILQAYSEWGKDCVRKFVGMWSLAIWNRKDESLFCSRDRFGIKPFLYIHEGGKFYFGSEYKPLKHSPLFSNQLNERQIRRGIQMGWVVYQDETYFEKIKSLPEASSLVFQNGQLRIEKYWEPDLNQKSTLSFREKKEEFTKLFNESVRLHMRSDVEVGACLSGGIDSSSITATVGKLFPEVPFRTFTIYYEGEQAVDERPWVNSVMARYPLIQNYAYSPQKDALRECFHRMCFHLDVPTNWSSDISQYYVMELAKKYSMKVLLDGQGSDEFLGGYMHTFYRLIGDALRRFNLPEATSILFDHRRNQEFSISKTADVFAKSVMSALFSEQQLYSMEYRNFHPFLPNTSDYSSPFSLKKASSNKLDNFLYHLLFNSMLPSLLHFEDRNSMAFSIESRVPFLDHRLVEFGFQLQNDERIHHGVTKYILRESMRGTVPDEVLDRRDKKGFTTPGAKWLHGDMHFLLEQDFSKLEMLDRVKIPKLIKEFDNGNDKLANLLWRVGGLNYWMENFV